MKYRQQILEPGMYYHVYNRAHGEERLFRVPENYRFFMQKYLRYVSPVADTYCYCLMPNHFHLLIRCKEEEDLMKFIEEERTRVGAGTKQQTLSTLTGLQDNLRRQSLLSKLITLQFSHLFNSYTQAHLSKII